MLVRKEVASQLCSLGFLRSRVAIFTLYVYSLRQPAFCVSASRVATLFKMSLGVEGYSAVKPKNLFNLKFTFSLQVVEKTEHADLWLEVMTQSGTEVLFGLLTASTPALQQTVLCAIKNLAAHPKKARLLFDYGLESVTQLLSSKVESCSGDIRLLV